MFRQSTCCEHRNIFPFLPQVVVFVNAVSPAKTNTTIRLSVKDSGIGVSAQDKDHIFTEGDRAEASQKVNPDSSGFGLFIVKGIVEAHDGRVRKRGALSQEVVDNFDQREKLSYNLNSTCRVWFESDGAGKGTTFFVEVSSA